MRACGAAIHAVDKIASGETTNAFCIVRPPGHHAGPAGLVDDGYSSCGFCIFNTVAVAALHALEVYGSLKARISFDNEHNCTKMVGF